MCRHVWAGRPPSLLAQPLLERPLLSAIAVLELMQTAKIIGSDSFRYTEPITLVGLFFLAMSLVSAALIRALERLLNRRTPR